MKKILSIAPKNGTQGGGKIGLKTLEQGRLLTQCAGSPYYLFLVRVSMVLS